MAPCNEAGTPLRSRAVPRLSHDADAHPPARPRPPRQPAPPEDDSDDWDSSRRFLESLLARPPSCLKLWPFACSSLGRLRVGERGASRLFASLRAGPSWLPPDSPAAALRLRDALPLFLKPVVPS